MSKTKKKFHSHSSDIHTIVDLPIEAVIEHLARLPQTIYIVHILEPHSDGAKFLIKNNQLRETMKVEARGRIQRWNGTFSRIDASLSFKSAYQTAPSSDILIKGKAQAQLTQSLKLLLGFFACFVLFFISLIFLRTNLLIILNLPLLLALMVFLGIKAIARLPSKNFIKYSHAEEEMMRMNSLLLAEEFVQNLRDELGSKLKQKAKTLEFDGTEDELTMLLRQEEYKKFRLGTDGEISTP